MCMVGSVFLVWFLCILAAGMERKRSIRTFVVIATVIRSGDCIPPFRLSASDRENTLSFYAERIGKGAISIPVAPSPEWQVILTR